MKNRASEEVSADIARMQAEAEAIKAKYKEGEEYSEEDAAKLKELVESIEALEKEEEAATVSERMAAIKQRREAPTRPAPKLPATVRNRTSENITAGEVFNRWFDSDRSHETYNRLRMANVSPGASRIEVPVNLGTLNRNKRKSQRTVLSKGGTGTGAELVWQSYSDKVIEYLTYFSPILSLVDSETTSDGNARTYFRVDDTNMISTFTSASGGTEIAPTIPETNLETGNAIINVFDITSGVQKVTFNELRDSYINLEDRIAKANSNSHARKMEMEVFQGSGNGSNGIEGLVTAATAYATTASLDQDTLLSMLMHIPLQYRKNAVFAAGDSVKNTLFSELRDTTGRSLFDRRLEDEVDWDTIYGKKFIVSSYIPSGVILCFVPEFYLLRLVSNQIFQQFNEKYWPHVAWGGIMSFGGAFLGPDNTCLKTTYTGATVGMAGDYILPASDMLREESHNGHPHNLKAVKADGTKSKK